MIGKVIVGLSAVAIVSVATTMSASAQQKRMTVAIPKQVCEMLTVGHSELGQQTVQLWRTSLVDLVVKPQANTSH